MITPPRPASGLLLLADISGYTAFLRAVQEAHADDAFADGDVPPAYAFVSSLLDSIIDRLVPPFALGKLEGDAVFVFSTDAAGIPHGDSLLACIRGCYATFQDRLAKAHEIWTCRCTACMRIDTLDLKFVLHAGPFVIQVIGGGEELSGPEVVMVHRLLKNEAAGRVGHGAYALLSETAAAMLEVDGDGGLRMTETYEHYAPIGTLVFPLR